MPVHFVPPSGGIGTSVRNRPWASQVNCRLRQHPNRLAFRRQQERESRERSQRAEGRDDRVHPKLGDDQAVDHAGERAGDDSRRAPQPPRCRRAGCRPRADIPTPTKTDAATTEPIDAIEPIEMSSAPAMITTVSPTASSPTITIAWARLFQRFCQEKNLLPPLSPNQPLTTVTRRTRTTSANMSERLSAPINADQPAKRVAALHRRLCFG